MHEMSLVKSLLRQVDEIAVEHQAGSVREVCVEIGPLSGVEPELVRSAFLQLCKTAHLAIRSVALTIRCSKCDQQSELADFVFRCDLCGSGRVRVVGGDEFRLLSVTFEERTFNESTCDPRADERATHA